MTLLSPEELRPSNRSDDIFSRHLRTLSVLADLMADSGVEEFSKAAALTVDCLSRDGKVLACGNGGSAADAQHFVAELVGRMLVDRPALAAVSLTSDSSVTTALGNDYGYDEVFARQVRALGRPGDLLVAISTSGTSGNVISAVRAAKQVGMQVIALTGPHGHATLNVADAWVRIESAHTPHVQELHTAFIHALCITVERTLFPGHTNALQLVR